MKAAPAASTSAPGKKLSFKEQSELKELPQKIEKMETELSQLQELTVQPAFYQQPQEKITETLAQLQKLQVVLEQSYQRWSELEGKASV